MSIAVGFYTVQELNDFLNLPLNVKYYDVDVPRTIGLFNDDYNEDVIRAILINPKMQEYIEPIFIGKKSSSKVIKIILEEDLHDNLDIKMTGNVLEKCIKIFNTTSDETREAITDYIAKHLNSGKYINEDYTNPISYISSLESKKITTPLLAQLFPKLDNPTQYLYDKNGTPIPYLYDKNANPIELFNSFYKMATTKEIINTSLGLRNAGLPSFVVENIASHTYDTSGMKLHEIMNIVASINERPRRVY